MGKSPKTKTVRIRYTFFGNHPNQREIEKTVLGWTSKAYVLTDRRENPQSLAFLVGAGRGWTELTFMEMQPGVTPVAVTWQPIAVSATVVSPDLPQAVTSKPNRLRKAVLIFLAIIFILWTVASMAKPKNNTSTATATPSVGGFFTFVPGE